MQISRRIIRGDDTFEQLSTTEVKRGKAVLALTIPQMRKTWQLLKYAPESKAKEFTMTAVEDSLNAVGEQAYD